MLVCLKAHAVPNADGGMSVFQADRVYDLSAKEVKGREEMFATVDDYQDQYARVESATAVPGVKRSVKKPAAKKSSKKAG